MNRSQFSWTGLLLLLLVGVTFFAQMSAAQQTPAASPAPAEAADKAGTAATPNDQAGAAAPAHLHIYRQRRYAGSALSPTIHINDKKVVRIGNGRRATIKLVPGVYSVRSDDKSSAISLDAKPGQDYFVRIDEEAGFWKGHGRLTLVMPDQGKAEFKLQKPAEEDRKYAREMIEEDVEAQASATPPQKDK